MEQQRRPSCRPSMGLLVLMVVALGASACSSRSGGVPRPFPGAPIPPDAAAPAGDEAPREAIVAPPPMPVLIATAMTFQGAPYRFGGSDPSGFDCSGFVQYVFARHGLALPREVRDQYRIGRSIRRDEIQPGDLVFFETVSRGASHVGIALGGHEFVHAPSSRGVVRVERYTSSYWSSRYVGARRLASAAMGTD